MYYDESLIPVLVVGKADFIWPSNNTQPTYTPGPPEPPEPTATSNPHTGLSGGIVAGIVVGTVVGVVIVLVLGLWILSSRKHPLYLTRGLVGQRPQRWIIIIDLRYLYYAS